MICISFVVINTIPFLTNTNAIKEVNETVAEYELLDVQICSTPMTNEIDKKEIITGYAIDIANVRVEPNLESEIIRTTDINEEILYSYYNDEWVIIYQGMEYFYVYSQYISDNPIEIKPVAKSKSKVKKVASINEQPIIYEEKIDEETETVEEDASDIVTENGEIVVINQARSYKSWMSYKAITSKSSPQYNLRQICDTDSCGLRVYDNRYIVAVGSGVCSNIGQYIDIILENGVVIPAIIGDQKANKDTISGHIFTRNGCCTEFLVDTRNLDSTSKQMGDVSYCYEGWDSPVYQIIVYNQNCLM